MCGLAHTLENRQLGNPTQCSHLSQLHADMLFEKTLLSPHHRTSIQRAIKAVRVFEGTICRMFHQFFNNE